MLENCMATITREQVTRHVPFWKKRWRNWKTVIMPLQLLQVWRQFSWYSACLKKAVISLLLVIYTGGVFGCLKYWKSNTGLTSPIGTEKKKMILLHLYSPIPKRFLSRRQQIR